MTLEARISRHAAFYSLAYRASVAGIVLLLAVCAVAQFYERFGDGKAFSV